MNTTIYTLSWGNLVVAIIALVAIYLVINLLADSLRRVNLLGRSNTAVTRILDFILQIYEPIAIIIIVGIFVFINPMLHGLLVGLLLVFAWLPVKNYINGRLVLLAHQLQTGQRITIDNASGLIRKLGRLGLSLQTREGMRFVNYTSLVKHGYLLLRGEQVGRLHKFLIGTRTGDLSITTLNNLLLGCPYLDWSLPPEVNPEANDDQQYLLQVLLREDEHLNFMLELIREWGFDCQLAD